MRRKGAKSIVVTDDLKRSVEQAVGRYGVMFAYVFGSAVSGHMREESDIDIAIYFDPRLSAEEKNQQALAIYGVLAGALTVPEEALDITVLNDASVLIKQVVMSEGMLIYERDHEARVEFELAVMRQRDDERHYRRLSRQVFLARLAKEGI